MPASMASARLEKLEVGQADMRTNQMNLIDLSTQRPPSPAGRGGVGMFGCLSDALLTQQVE